LEIEAHFVFKEKKGDSSTKIFQVCYRQVPSAYLLRETNKPTSTEPGFHGRQKGSVLVPEKEFLALKMTCLKRLL
jgi:hypothetical protein